MMKKACILYLVMFIMLLSHHSYAMQMQQPTEATVSSGDVNNMLLNAFLGLAQNNKQIDTKCMNGVLGVFMDAWAIYQDFQAGKEIKDLLQKIFNLILKVQVVAHDCGIF